MNSYTYTLSYSDRLFLLSVFWAHRTKWFGQGWLSSRTGTRPFPRGLPSILLHFADPCPKKEWIWSRWAVF